MSVTHPGTAAAAFDATGSGTFYVGPPPTGVAWRIHQLAVSSSPAGLMFLVGTVNGLPLLTPVLVQSGAAADGEPPIELGSHTTMVLNITKAVPFAQGILAYYYEEIPDT